MAENKRLSDLPIATIINGTDRLVILSDPSGTPVAKTVTISGFIENNGQLVTATELSANLVNYTDYDIRSWKSGTPSSNEIIFGSASVRSLTLAANFSGSVAKSLTASTGTYVLTVNKNGSSIGTITFTTSNTGTFATSGGTSVSIVSGDVITIVGASSADASIANISITLKGTLAI